MERQPVPQPAREVPRRQNRLLTPVRAAVASIAVLAGTLPVFARADQTTPPNYNAAECAEQLKHLNVQPTVIFDRNPSFSPDQQPRDSKLEKNDGFRKAMDDCITHTAEPLTR